MSKRIYINNFKSVLTEPLAADKTGSLLNLAPAALQALINALPAASNPEAPDAMMRLTLQTACDYELIDVYRHDQDIMIYQGGAENTTPKAWDVGTSVINAATAGSFEPSAHEVHHFSDYQTEPQLNVDYRNGDVQLFDASLIEPSELDRYGIHYIEISHMQEGDELLLSIEHGDHTVPVFVNASELKAQ